MNRKGFIKALLVLPFVPKIIEGAKKQDPIVIMDELHEHRELCFDAEVVRGECIIDGEKLKEILEDVSGAHTKQQRNNGIRLTPMTRKKINARRGRLKCF